MLGEVCTLYEAINSFTLTIVVYVHACTCTCPMYTNLSSRLVLRVAAEVESHEFPCSLLSYGDGSGCQVAMHHLDVSMEEAEGLC